MSDLQDKLNEILSNPEALKQVQSLGEQLGLTNNNQNLSNLLNNSNSAKNEPPQPSKKENAEISPVSSLNGFSGNDMLGTLTRIAPVLGSIKDDDTTRLLEALRPFLSSDKQTRLDQAEKMLRILKIMPLIKESGLF